MSEVLTANQAYKASGSTLSFAEWLRQEKERGSFFMNDTLSSIVEQSRQNLGITPKPPKPESQDKIIGIPKNILYISGAVIVIAIAVKIYQNSKS